jgi:hypothetical protein
MIVVRLSRDFVVGGGFLAARRNARRQRVTPFASHYRSVAGSRTKPPTGISDTSEGSLLRT